MAIIKSSKFLSVFYFCNSMYHSIVSPLLFILLRLKFLLQLFPSLIRWPLCSRNRFDFNQLLHRLLNCPIAIILLTPLLHPFIGFWWALTETYIPNTKEWWCPIACSFWVVIHILLWRNKKEYIFSCINFCKVHFGGDVIRE